MLSAARAHGFTLIEILIVAAIMGLLTAIALPAMRGARERVVTARTRVELALIAQALENYRRLYGDYPQTGDFAQAPPETAQPLIPTHAQAKIFNALNGVFGPRAFAGDDRINGCPLIDVTKFTLEFASDGEPQAPAGEAPRKEEVCTSLLDPWGRRYLYYYKRASDPAAWRTTGYILYSAGPDGRHMPPGTVSEIARPDLPPASVNIDNVYADALMR